MNASYILFILKKKYNQFEKSFIIKKLFTCGFVIRFCISGFCSCSRNWGIYCLICSWRAGLFEIKGLSARKLLAIFGSACIASIMDRVYGALNMLWTNWGFSDICCNKLDICGVFTTPGLGVVGDVVGLLVPVPHGLGNGSRFSAPEMIRFFILSSTV